MDYNEIEAKIARLKTLHEEEAKSTSSGSGRILMPKVKHKFRVLLHNITGIKNTTGLTQQVVSVTRPKLRYADVMFGYGITGTDTLGQGKWDDFTMVVRDDVTNSASAIIQAQIEAQKINPEIRFGLTIEVLFDENVIEQWSSNGCRLVEVAYDELTYMKDEPVLIQVTIKVDDMTIKL